MGIEESKGLIRLVKFYGRSRIVDYGVPGKEAAYIALGYIVQNSQFPRGSDEILSSENGNMKAKAEGPR